MKITYDKHADAIYIYFQKGKVKKTVAMSDDFIVDQDKHGAVLGLEILNASRNLRNRTAEPRITIGNKSVRLPALAA